MLDVDLCWLVEQWHRFSISPTKWPRIRADCPWTNRQHHLSCIHAVGTNWRFDLKIRSLHGMSILGHRKWCMAFADVWPHNDGINHKRPHFYADIVVPAIVIWCIDKVPCKYNWNNDTINKENIYKLMHIEYELNNNHDGWVEMGEW